MALVAQRTLENNVNAKCSIQNYFFICKIESSCSQMNYILVRGVSMRHKNNFNVC